MLMMNDPGRVSSRIRQAAKDIHRRTRTIKDGIRQIIDSNTITVNKTYLFELDELTYRRITTDMQALLDAVWLEGGETHGWLAASYVVPAYNQGIAQTLAALRPQTQTKTLMEKDVEAVLYQPAYQRRIALVRARIYEEMGGLTATMKTDLAQTMARSVAAGHGAQRVKSDILRRVDIGGSRALRIARTEIGTAHKQAKLDETDDSAESLGLEMRMMHFSAFSSTSRSSHMARHGHLYTTDQVRQWLAEDANAINCLCSIEPVLVDPSTKQPLSDIITKRAKAIKERASTYG